MTGKTIPKLTNSDSKSLQVNSKISCRPLVWLSFYHYRFEGSFPLIEFLTYLDSSFSNQLSTGIQVPRTVQIESH